ncbi:MAG: hypothetical protein P8X84_04050, partial [Candidatus Bathyarchaeota archaeon]
ESGSVVTFEGWLINNKTGEGIKNAKIDIIEYDRSFLPDKILISGNTAEDGRFSIEWEAHPGDWWDNSVEVYSKFSGKQGRHAVGFFSVQDDITNFLIPGREGSSSESFDKSSQGSALRYKMDLLKSSNIGVILSDRESKDYYNRMGGIDGDVKFTQSDRLTFQALQSRTQYPDSIRINYDQPDKEFIGNAYYTQYIHSTKNYHV